MPGKRIDGYYRKWTKTKWLSVRIVFLVFLFHDTAAQTAQGHVNFPEHRHDTTGIVFIGTVKVTGNRITRENIITRELLLLPGQAIDRSELDSLVIRSEENLINTSLFNFADISVISMSRDTVDLNVDVTERWYIWPIPYIRLGDRNFNVWWETRDFARLTYGVNLDWRNFTGRRDNLVTSLQFGYDQLFGIRYTLPYLDRAQTMGLSIGAAYARNHETAYLTREDKQQFYREESGFASEEITVSLQFSLRPSIYNTHLIDVSFDHYDFSDTILVLNEMFTPDGKDNFGIITLHYAYKSDHRDYKHYPLNGHYFDVEVVKQGLPLIDNSGTDDVFVKATFRKYWELHPRIYFAAGLNGKFSSAEDEPYMFTRAIGYDRDIVRGYEYYVADGQSFGIMKTNLKFALIPNRVREIGFIRSEKFRKTFFAFYLNLFADTGYADNVQSDPALGNVLQNELLIGYGAGLDFVTYYDIVIRMEYSFNKMGESGFFIHFRAPI